MASSSQQPRGLPGFLRRTFRNSYEQELDVPTPTSGTQVMTTETVGSDNEMSADGGQQSDISDDAEERSQADVADVDDNKGVAKNLTNTPEQLKMALEGRGSGSKKHLRAVAFPPLPGESVGDSSDSRSATSTPPLPRAQSPNNNSTPTTATEGGVSPTPKRKSYKETQFEAILSSPIIPLRDLRKLSWNGVPPHHRSTIWKILLGYLPANTSRHSTTLTRRRREYQDAIKQHYDIPDDTRTNSEQETLRQVLVDVPRTAPEVPLFHNDRVRRCLSRLLYIWAMRHPASSYVQGINDLATPLIAVFLRGYFNDTETEHDHGEEANEDGAVDDIGPMMRQCLDGEIMADVTDQMLMEVEADTYWCLTNLLAGIQDHYTSDQPGMQRMVMHLEELVNRIDVDLANHLKNMGIEFLQFAFKWMNCLLLREFKLECIFRLWDSYLSEEGGGGFEDFHVYVCASFLVHFSNELQQMGFDELFQFMQNMPTDDWGDREIEILLSSAYVLSTLFGGSEAHLNVVRNG